MKGLVKTLIKPDWDDNPKRSEILHAANLLQIGEFQLIQLAYKVWYEQDLPEDAYSGERRCIIIIRRAVEETTTLPYCTWMNGAMLGFSP